VGGVRCQTRKSLRVWDASECVLMFIDYQDHVLDVIFAQDRRVIELNVRTLTKMAVAFKIPVILSTPWRPLAARRAGYSIDNSAASRSRLGSI
jgi:nicotinamidase-related amidase